MNGAASPHETAGAVATTGGGDSWSDVSEDDDEHHGSPIQGRDTQYQYAPLSNRPPTDPRPDTENTDNDEAPVNQTTIPMISESPNPGRSVNGTPSEPTVSAATVGRAVAAAAVRSMFPPPERPPPVAPARVEADDIELPPERVNEIRSLMAGLSLPAPPGGFPPWMTSLDGESVQRVAATTNAPGRSLEESPDVIR